MNVVKIAQSCLTLCDPMDCIPPGYIYNLDMKKIEQEAQRLGLRPPMKNQIKYISLGNTDNGEVLKTEETNVLSAFINRMSVILEYLY